MYVYFEYIFIYFIEYILLYAICNMQSIFLYIYLKYIHNTHIIYSFSACFCLKPSTRLWRTCGLRLYQTHPVSSTAHSSYSTNIH